MTGPRKNLKRIVFIFLYPCMYSSILLYFNINQVKYLKINKV